MENDLDEQQSKAASDQAGAALNKLGNMITDANADFAPLEVVLRNRMEAVGVPYELDSIKDVGHIIGFVIGRLQSAGASVTQVHDVVRAMSDFRPEDDYEIQVFGSGACGIIAGVHADQLWRIARLLRAAIHEIYISLRNISPIDANIQSHNAHVVVAANWTKAVGVAEAFVDIMYPLIQQG